MRGIITSASENQKTPRRLIKKKGTCNKRIGCKKALGYRDMKMKCAGRFCVFSNRIERTRSLKIAECQDKAVKSLY